MENSEYCTTPLTYFVPKKLWIHIVHHYIVRQLSSTPPHDVSKRDWIQMDTTL